MLNDNISAHMFQVVFENSPVGLVVVNGDISLQSMNNYMFATFNIDPKDFHERMLGNALKCSDIYLTGKNCGEGDHCNDCSLRKVLSTALMEGVHVPEMVFEHEFIINGTSRKKSFKVSVSSVVTGDEIFGVLSFVDITTQIDYENLLKRQLSLDAATGDDIIYYCLLDSENGDSDLLSKFDLLLQVHLGIPTYSHFYALIDKNYKQLRNYIQNISR